MSNLSAAGDQHPLQRIPIEVTVCVGKARPSVRELLAMEENAILPLDRKVVDPVELFIGDKLIARGQLQEYTEGETGQLAIRLTEIAVSKDDLS